MTISRNLLLTPLAVASLMLVGCNTSNNALESSKNEATRRAAEQAAEEAKAAEEEQPNIIRKRGAVPDRGTYIRVLVNGAPITNYDINRRANFLKVRREGGNRKKKATDEMIEQQIKLQEAKKLGTLASDQQVDQAFSNFAKGNRATPAQMANNLNKIGVGADHFKEYVRAQISWNRAVGAKFRSQTKTVSDTELFSDLRKSGGAKPQLTEYKIQQIVFVVPAAKRKSMLKARRAEANAMRQRFTTCEDSINLAKQLRDVSVLNRGRVMEPELPTEWKDGVKNAGVGGTTKVRETSKGIEFIAVCDAKQVSDDRAAKISKQSEEFSELSGKGDKLSQEFLAEVKAKAKIVYR